jgi:CHASE3 domain sensor protein
MTRKVALQMGACALLVFIAWNAFLTIKHLRQLQSDAALTLESSMAEAEIFSVLRDITDMETGQRGYLLTANDSYLQPYNNARSRIESDFAALRSRFRNRSEREQALLSQLEVLSNAKQAEMERSITLRQQGYRRRAFRLVDSDEGMEYMDKARGLLASLYMEESSRFATFDRQRNLRQRKALIEIVITNASLLLLTACLFVLIRYYVQSRERAASETGQKLAARNLQLAKLTSALSNQARFKTTDIEANAQLLLQNYGGFLPRQGHQYAEQIREASVQMELLRQDLVGSQDTNNNKEAEYDSVA